MVGRFQRRRVPLNTCILFCPYIWLTNVKRYVRNWHSCSYASGGNLMTLGANLIAQNKGHLCSPRLMLFITEESFTTLRGCHSFVQEMKKVSNFVYSKPILIMLLNFNIPLANFINAGVLNFINLNIKISLFVSFFLIISNLMIRYNLILIYHIIIIM